MLTSGPRRAKAAGINISLEPEVRAKAARCIQKQGERKGEAGTAGGQGIGAGPLLHKASTRARLHCMVMLVSLNSMTLLHNWSLHWIGIV